MLSIVVDSPKGANWIDWPAVRGTLPIMLSNCRPNQVAPPSFFDRSLAYCIRWNTLPLSSPAVMASSSRNCLSLSDSPFSPFSNSFILIWNSLISFSRSVSWSLRISMLNSYYSICRIRSITLIGFLSSSVLFDRFTIISCFWSMLMSSISLASCSCILVSLRVCVSTGFLSTRFEGTPYEIMSLISDLSMTFWSWRTIWSLMDLSNSSLTILLSFLTLLSSSFCYWITGC